MSSGRHDALGGGRWPGDVGQLGRDGPQGGGDLLAARAGWHIEERGRSDQPKVARECLGGTPNSTPVRVADVLAATLVERPLLCDLFAHVSSTLEHNVSPLLGRDFKVRLVDLTGQLAASIAAALVDVPAEQAFEMVAGTYALVAGLWPICNPPPELAALLEGPALRHTRVSFKDALRRMLEALLVGLTRA